MLCKWILKNDVSTTLCISARGITRSKVIYLPAGKRSEVGKLDAFFRCYVLHISAARCWVFIKKPTSSASSQIPDFTALYTTWSWSFQTLKMVNHIVNATHMMDNNQAKGPQTSQRKPQANGISTLVHYSAR